MSGDICGGINAETIAEALTFARGIASEHQRRVRLTVNGRGVVGQLMWTVRWSTTGGASWG